jgi:nucleotide-binding universal stress UspA family protein
MRILFDRLLVPLDGTTEAAVAVPAATTVARATGASITLVRVPAGGNGPAEVLLGHQVAQDELRATAEALAASGLQVDWVLGTPPVPRCIVDVAAERNTDVIVMASHGRSGLARAFAGSVSERVLAASDRMVLLLKPGDKPLRQIQTVLVPVDGTAGGALALCAAVGLARATGARLVLVDVVPPTPWWMYSAVGAAPMMYIDPARDEEAEHSAQTYVEGLSRKLRTSGLRVGMKAVRGDVVTTIDAVAEQTGADIIVMSTHALTGPARAVLGSVADAVVRTSHRPVLLVRRGDGVFGGGEDVRDSRADVAARANGD